MTKRTSTKSALLTSILSLTLCCAMLLGTTFAWFTNTVTSGVNRIVAGNLDIELFYRNAATNKDASLSTEDYWKNVASIPAGDDPQFFVDVNGDSILWEPGVMAVTEFKVANVGTLALKYELKSLIGACNSLNGHSLDEAIKFAVIENGSYADAAAVLAQVASEGKTFGAFDTFSAKGELYPEKTPANASEPSEKIFTVVAYWKPGTNDFDNQFNANNGNKAKLSDGAENLWIDIEIQLFATQFTYEKDSFDEQYDSSATYPIPVLPAATYTATPVVDTDTNAVVEDVVIGDSKFSVTIPKESADPDVDYKVDIGAASTPDGITVAVGQSSVTYEIKVYKVDRLDRKTEVSGVTMPVKVYVGPGHNDIEAYHNASAIAIDDYDKESGYIYFKTDSCSPFTFLFENLPNVKLPANVSMLSFRKANKTIYVDKVNGDEHFFNTFDAALKASKSGANFYCMPGADVFYGGAHIDVTHTVTIYGNGATAYKDSNRTSVGDFSIETDVSFEGDTVLTINDLKNAAAWGSRKPTTHGTSYDFTLIMNNCDTSAEGFGDQRIYIEGGTGHNECYLYDCDFASNTSCTFKFDRMDVLVVENCTYKGISEPFNIKIDKNASDITIKNVTFTNCGGGTSNDATYAAPIRVVNNSAEGSGTAQDVNVTIDNCKFLYSDGKTSCNGDILMGDGRANKMSDNITLTVKNTNADIQFQKPDFYPNKLAENIRFASVTANETLNTSIDAQFAIAGSSGPISYIGTAADLMAFGANSAPSGTYFLTSDIDMSGYKYATPYVGGGKNITIFGNGHTISNLTINGHSCHGSGVEGGAGLLGFVDLSSEITIKDLTFDNAHVESDGKWIGVVVGYVSNSTTVFDNVHVKNSFVKGQHSVGGVIGWMGNPSTSLTFNNCSVTDTDIIFTETTRPRCGVFAGYDYGDLTFTNNTTNVTALPLVSDASGDELAK